MWFSRTTGRVPPAAFWWPRWSDHRLGGPRWLCGFVALTSFWLTARPVRRRSSRRRFLAAPTARERFLLEPSRGRPRALALELVPASTIDRTLAMTPTIRPALAAGVEFSALKFPLPVLSVASLLGVPVLLPGVAMFTAGSPIPPPARPLWPRGRGRIGPANRRPRRFGRLPQPAAREPLHLRIRMLVLDARESRQ